MNSGDRIEPDGPKEEEFESKELDDKAKGSAIKKSLEMRRENAKIRVKESDGSCIKTGKGQSTEDKFELRDGRDEFSNEDVLACESDGKSEMRRCFVKNISSIESVKQGAVFALGVPARISQID